MVHANNCLRTLWHVEVRIKPTTLLTARLPLAKKHIYFYDIALRFQEGHSTMWTRPLWQMVFYFSYITLPTTAFLNIWHYIKSRNPNISIVVNTVCLYISSPYVINWHHIININISILIAPALFFFFSCYSGEQNWS